MIFDRKQTGGTGPFSRWSGFAPIGVARPKGAHAILTCQTTASVTVSLTKPRGPRVKRMNYRILTGLFLALFSTITHAITDDDLLEPGKAFRFSASPAGESTIRAQWDIADS